ncbi:unnamed protein product [Mortierella alpina]
MRNLPHIRSVELKTSEHSVFPHLTRNLKPGISARVASKLCTNLRRLKLECYYNILYLKLPPIIKLLDHNLQLTHLTLPIEALTTDDALLAAIPKLQRLRHLAFEDLKQCPDSRDPYIGGRIIPLLLQACLPLPELTELLLDFDMVWEDKATELNNELVNTYSKVLGTQDVQKNTVDLEAVIAEAATARFFENLLHDTLVL